MRIALLFSLGFVIISFFTSQNLRGQESESKFQLTLDQKNVLDLVYDYDSNIATEAFNILGADSCQLPIERLKHAACYSLRDKNNSFLNSDFSRKKLRDLLFKLLEQHEELKLTDHEAHILKAVCARYKEESECGHMARCYMMKRICELAKSRGNNVDHREFIKVFCENISVKFLRSITNLHDHIKTNEQLKQINTLIESSREGKGLSTELLSMVYIEKSK